MKCVTGKVGESRARSCSREIWTHLCALSGDGAVPVWAQRLPEKGGRVIRFDGVEITKERREEYDKQVQRFRP